MKLRHDLTGKTFGRWVVLKRDDSRKDRCFWLCRCICGIEKSINSGDLIAGHSKGCRGCATRDKSLTHGLSRSKRYALYHNAFQRAKREGVPFKIRPEDVPEIPVVCPLLGITFCQSNTVCRPDSPTLHRILPPAGYVKDNIWIISHRANTIKSDASVDELILLAKKLAERRIQELSIAIDRAIKS